MLNPALVYLLRRRRNGRRSCKRGIIGIRRVFESPLLRVYVSVFDRFVRYDILSGDFRFSRVTCYRIWRSNRWRAARQNASRISSYRRHGYSNRVAYKASLTSVSKSLRRRDVFSRYGELAYLNRLRADYGRLPCSMPQKISKAKRTLRSLIVGIEKSSIVQIFFLHRWSSVAKDFDFFLPFYFFYDCRVFDYRCSVSSYLENSITFSWINMWRFDFLTAVARRFVLWNIVAQRSEFFGNKWKTWKFERVSSYERSSVNLFRTIANCYMSIVNPLV